MSNDSSKRVQKLKQLPNWAKAGGIVVSGFSIFVIAQFAAVLLISLLLALGGVKADGLEDLFSDSSLVQFVVVALIEAFVLFGVMGILNFTGRSLKVLNFAIPSLKTLLKVLGYFGMYLLLTYVATILVSIFVPSVDVDQAQQIGFDSAKGTDLIWVFLALCVAAPIGEEVLFRGFLYRSLKKYTGIILAGVITTVLFGIAHLEFGSGAPLNWIAAIDTALFSLALIYTYEKEKTLLAPISLHMLKNTLAFIFLFVVSK